MHNPKRFRTGWIGQLDWFVQLRIVPKVYFDHLTSKNGLWEIRTQVGSNIYRVFCCFDEGNLVILLSGFQKKTQKTLQKEIDKAERIRKEYFDGKN
jgi:phage-related protein